MIGLYSKLSLYRVFAVVLGIFCFSVVAGQVAPILNYSTNQNGQVQLEVSSTTDHYYILKARHDVTGPFEIFASMTMGEQGTTVISESLGNYPIEHYQVLEYSVSNPADSDGDGINDIVEFNNIPNQAPLNAAPQITMVNGLVSLDSSATFNSLSVKQDEVQWSEYLNGLEFVKYIIVDFDTPNPKIYFMNSNTHNLHADFANVYGIDYLGSHIKKGHLIYHPSSISSNGTFGTYAFNYSNAEGMEFEIVQRTQELLAANMPFLKNNLSYFITINNEGDYYDEIDLYQNARVSVLFEANVYAEVDYWGLNPAEGFGLFRQMTLNETPGQKDIVLYESLPNSLPRVGGIITSVIQTPLSHVNLRAIQDNIPNAFIRDPLDNDSIADLLDHYIYYKVEQNKYTIREATLEEVNNWFENIRPSVAQTPPLNLDYQSILPLDDISHVMYDGFGAKCANIAEMRTFGFPDGTIPDGFGVPFYFYQEFMNHNHLFEEIEMIMSDPNFITDRNQRQIMLSFFRHSIENGEMPNWMMDELAEMQNSFPVGTSIRCRSSTNNEDLPEFSGAGLYDSKTQHPDEGHISKSIRQVYASLWNLRAFEERDFYRVDHFNTSMGVLCHPNFSDEKVNGVGVSTDPIYNTSNTFYLNSQLGEDLITNPGSSTPEELLLNQDPESEDEFTVIQRSSLIPASTLLMNDDQLNKMREYLTVIHNEFEWIYNAVGNPTFAMDIEFKITADDQLAIKQARPWVSYKPNETTEPNVNLTSGLNLYPNPFDSFIHMSCFGCQLSDIRITNVMGSLIRELKPVDSDNSRLTFDLSRLAPGIYVISGYSEIQNKYYAKKVVKL